MALTSEHEAAFARVRAELGALPDHEVRHITVHVPAAAVLVLGALPKMRALREAMVAELTNPPVDALDKLEDYALAAARAHAGVLPVDAGASELRALVNEATPLRERLLMSGAAAASYGLLDPKQIAAIRKGSGHLDLAQDLWALVTLFRKAWPALSSKVPCTPADLERAAELSRLMLKALGQRDQGTDGSNEPGEAEAQLAKVYELFRRAYEACRHAIVYLRRNEGDADDFAPPLGQSRRARRPRAEEPAPAEPDGGEGEGAEPDAVGEGDSAAV